MPGGDGSQGYISQIQDFCVHDGDGIRTTIFFCGCPLRCQWCANPETWCVEDGRVMTVDEIVAHCTRQRIFYSHSGGGVTISGGEPGHQPQFAASLVRKLREKGFDVAMETCGFFSWPEMQKSLQDLDLLFFDLKHPDDARHRSLTGQSNQVILQNFIRAAEIIDNLVVRLPLIPGINDHLQDLEATATFIRSHMRTPRIELLPYHDWSTRKYETLGLEFHEFPIPSDTDIDRARAIFEQNEVAVVDFK